MLDNDGKYWESLKVNFWPTYFIVDQNGTITKKGLGEMHKGQKKADDLEAEIKKLLNM